MDIETTEDMNQHLRKTGASGDVIEILASLHAVRIHPDLANARTLELVEDRKNSSDERIKGEADMTYRSLLRKRPDLQPQVIVTAPERTVDPENDMTNPVSRLRGTFQPKPPKPGGN